MYKVVVSGSRDWVPEFDKYIYSEFTHLPPDTYLIHGAARGLDSVAASIGDAKYNFSTLAVPCTPEEWTLFGKQAGKLRNSKMLAMKPDLVLAFRVNFSNGTTDTIEKAKKLKIKTVVNDIRCIRDDEGKIKRVEHKRSVFNE